MNTIKANNRHKEDGAAAIQTGNELGATTGVGESNKTFRY